MNIVSTSKKNKDLETLSQEGGTHPVERGLTSHFQLIVALLECGSRDPYILIAFIQIITGIQIFREI